MDKQQVWANALEKLQKSVSTISYDLWVKSLEPIDFKDGIYYLSTTSETAKQRINAILKNDIASALATSSDEIKDFVILDPEERAEYGKNQELELEVGQNKVPGVNTFNPKYTFDNFVVGNSNKYVYAACKGVAEHPFSKINPLFIYGGVGLGKTHLLHSIGNFINKNNPEMKVMYFTTTTYIMPEFESELNG
jgi:chromosomal replication initiator protein